MMRLTSLALAFAWLIAAGSLAGAETSRGGQTAKSAAGAAAPKQLGLDSAEVEPPAASPAVPIERRRAPNMPSPHRKSEVGVLKIANRQTRQFLLDCETCAQETAGRVYQAPPAMNLRPLDGKRVRVTFDISGKVQSVRRIDAHRRVSVSKPDGSRQPD